jgi:hypothetical protein
MKVQLRKFYLAPVLIALISGRIYDMISQSPLYKYNVVTELSMEKIHLQIMLYDFG